MITREVGCSKQHRWWGVIDIEQIIKLIVWRRSESNRNLWVVSADGTVKRVVGGCPLLDETPIEGLRTAVVELLGKEEWQSIDGYWWWGSGWIQETIDHTLLSDGTGPLSKWFCWEINDIEERKLILDNWEITNCIGDSIIPRSAGSISVCICVPIVTGSYLVVLYGIS